MKTSPYEISTAKFPLPFSLWPPQIAAVDDLAALPRSAYYAEVGTGKTAMSTVAANFQRMIGMADCHIIVMPPILQMGWYRWLQRIPGVRVVLYRGTPKERAQIFLQGADFIIMSLPIFKLDYERISKEFAERSVGLIVDEATSIKNSGSDNHRKVRDFSAGRPLILLTGTPTASPEDGYAYVKLLAPEVYRNKRIFDSVHVAERDFFGSVIKWNNLDLLKKNMEINTVRLLKAECMPWIPKPIYTPMPYTLAPEHMALYRQLVDQQVLELENGGKIDATQVAKLFTCCQQIVLNWSHFSGDPTKAYAAQGYELLDEVLEELGTKYQGGRKLIVYAYYRMTVASLAEKLKPYGVRVINSTVTSKQQELNKEAFINNPSCRVLVIQPKSGAYGVDGLQDVCSDALFLESPTSPIEFEQAVGRLYRTGQTRPPHIRIAVAEGTIQARLHNLLLHKDELATYVQGGWKSLREAVYGG